MYYFEYESPIGLLYISSDDNYLLGIQNTKPKDYIDRASEIIKECIFQLDKYFKKELTQFNLPLKFSGSDFNQLVLKKMSEVKYGELITYKQLAMNSNQSKAYRAVGSVCASNPFIIVVPCHRVIKSDLTIGNYALGVNIKEFLLDLESHTNSCTQG